MGEHYGRRVPDGSPPEEVSPFRFCRVFSRSFRALYFFREGDMVEGIAMLLDCVVIGALQGEIEIPALTETLRVGVWAVGGFRVPSHGYTSEHDRARCRRGNPGLAGCAPDDQSGRVRVVGGEDVLPVLDCGGSGTVNWIAINRS
jgi:hypothetical protein